MPCKCLRPMMRLTVVLSAMAFLPYFALAKRSAPPRVEPAIHDSIRYAAPNDDGRRAYIEAWDVQTNKKLWELTVFTNHIEPRLEEDVQWVFIIKLNVRDGTLLVISERGNTYQIDLKTKAITQSDITKSATPDATAQLHDIPEVINRAVTNGLLPKEYELSFRVNPFYLRGDFIGDGKADIAILVKQRSTGKLGIAIINGATDKVTVVGAGNAIGNGGDDFAGRGKWQLYFKAPAIHQAARSVSQLPADGLVPGASS